MLKTYDFHSFIQRPHFSQSAENLFWAGILTPADIAAYKEWFLSNLSHFLKADPRNGLFLEINTVK